MNKEGAGLREGKNARMILWNSMARKEEGSSSLPVHMAGCHSEKTRLKMWSQGKRRKYERLVTEFVRVRVIGLVVSSMRSLSGQSLKDFEKV
jgi:hypothetical protein